MTGTVAAIVTTASGKRPVGPKRHRVTPAFIVTLMVIVFAGACGRAHLAGDRGERRGGAGAMGDGAVGVRPAVARGVQRRHRTRPIAGVWRGLPSRRHLMTACREMLGLDMESNSDATP